MTDTFARDITYARISLTDHCNLSCLYCMPQGGLPPHRDKLSFDELEQLIQALAAAGVRKIRFTGGEPMMRPGVLDFFRRVCKTPGVDTWALTTNALTLARDAVLLRDAGIDLINISLDTMDPDAYRSLTGGCLDDALAGLHAALDAGFMRVKLNAVLMKGMSEGQIAPLAEWARSYPVDVRFIELMPMGPCQDFAAEHFLPATAVLDLLPGLVPDTPEPHAPAAYYRLPGFLGRIGLITPVSCNFCASCNRIRITADGKFRPCLHADAEIDLRAVMHDAEGLTLRLAEAVIQKPEHHLLAEGQFMQHGMSEVGG